MEPTLNGYYTTGERAGQLIQPAKPISVSSLNSTESPLNVPPPSPPKDYSGLTSIGLESLLGAYNAPSQEEGASDNLQEQILKSIDTLGTERTRKQELEGVAGLPKQRQELQGVVNQLQALQKEAMAIPLQIQQESEGRGRTAGGVAPLQQGRLRENAIKSLSLSAAGQTMLGNIQLADANIASALEAEFEPERTRLATLKQLYDFNKDALERKDKKRADALNVYLKERERLLGLEQADKNEIYNIGKIAGNFGADTATIQKIFTAKTREEALALAGQYMQDPRAKIELENAKLDTLLKKAQIARTQRETALLGQPTATERKEIAAALKEAQAAIPVMQDKLAAVDVIKNAKGLQYRVGPNRQARQGILLGVPGVFGVGSSIPSLLSEASGAGQDFAGGVHKLVSGLTLDNLIAAKARGATFGALSEGELSILASSATAINDWEIKDKDGKGTGYWNIDEASFKREMDTIKSLTQRALIQSGQSLYDDEEQALFDSIGSDALTAPAANYF